MTSDENRNIKDFVDYQPENIKLLGQAEFEIAGKHHVILRALREKIMTVKELHDLYLIDVEDEKRTHSVTQQSVYRYLEELEKAELIMVVGYRKTEGVKSSERIYGRTSKIFMMIPNTEIPDMESEEQQAFLDKLGRIISMSLGEDHKQLDPSKFVKFYKKYVAYQAESLKKLFERAKEHNVDLEMFSEMSIEQVNELMWYAQQFIPFIRNPEIFTQLKDIFH